MFCIHTGNAPLLAKIMNFANSLPPCVDERLMSHLPIIRQYRADNTTTQQHIACVCECITWTDDEEAIILNSSIKWCVLSILIDCGIYCLVYAFCFKHRAESGAAIALNGGHVVYVCVVAGVS